MMKIKPTRRKRKFHTKAMQFIGKSNFDPVIYNWKIRTLQAGVIKSPKSER